MLDGLFEQHRLVALISRSLCFPDISYCWKSMNQFAKNLHFPGSQDVILLCYAVKLRESLCQYRTRHKKYVACANNKMNCVHFFYHSKVNHAMAFRTKGCTVTYQKHGQVIIYIFIQS